MTDFNKKEFDLGKTLGHILASQEEMRREIQENTGTMKSIYERVVAVEYKISTARTVIKTLKFVGGIILLVITFKFGQLTDIWNSYFKG